MDKQDIEQKLQESAEHIEVREFSEVWQDIKDKIEPAPVKKRKLPRWLPALATVACGVVVCATAIPLALYYNRNTTVVNNSAGQSSSTTESVLQSSPSNETSEQRYVHDKLNYVKTTIEAFNSELQQSQIHYIDFSQYTINLSYLFTTEEGIAKGGEVEFTDNLGFNVKLQLYSSDVDVSNQENINYDLNHAVGTTQIQYRLKEAIPEYSIYVYDIKTVHNDTQYFMEYTCATEDIKPFLNELFG